MARILVMSIIACAALAVGAWAADRALSSASDRPAIFAGTNNTGGAAAATSAAPRTAERPDAVNTLPLKPANEAATKSPSRGASGMNIPWPTISSALGSLGIVLGAFLLILWVLKKSGGKSSTALPKEAFEVLGRAPLAGRQQAQLIRCGGKLLLVCITPHGVETLTEITDPGEVQRLLGVCLQSNESSATAAFRKVLAQFAQEKTTGGFLGHEIDAFDAERLASRRREA